MRLDQQTRTAISATLHCLTGCAIGESLGLALATWWGWSNGPSVALAFVLAFVFGYPFTVVPVFRSGMTLGHTGEGRGPSDNTGDTTLFHGPHTKGANFLYADGHVRWLPNTINYKVYTALSTRALGEVIGNDY